MFLILPRLSLSSLPLSRALSLSLSLSASLLLHHTDRVVKGTHPMVQAEQTASSLPSPAGGRVLSSSVRVRDPDTDQQAAAFPQPENAGKKRGEEWRLEGLFPVQVVDSPYRLLRELPPGTQCLQTNVLCVYS